MDIEPEGKVFGSPVQEEHDVMTITTSSTPTANVTFEYATVRADRTLEPLYKDTYASLGWSAETDRPTNPSGKTTTIKLKRDRHIKNRPMLVELQRRAEGALTSISSMERSKVSIALTVALIVGIIGAGFLAGSVFALTAGFTVMSIALGTVGLIGWAAGYLSFGKVRDSRAAKLAPLVDRQYDIVYSACEQAAKLRA